MGLPPMTPPPAAPKPAPSLHEEAVRGSAWSFLVQIGTQVITLAVWSVLGWNLTPAEIGVVAFAQLMIAFLMIFGEQGYADALVRRKELTRADENTVFWTSMGGGLLLALAVNLAAGPLAGRLGEPRLEAMLRALSVSFPLMAFRVVPEAIMLRAMRMRELGFRTLAATLVSGIVGCGMALRGGGAWSLVAQSLVHLLVGTVLLWWRSGWRPGWTWDFARFRELFRFGIHLTGGNLFAYYNLRFDQWMVGAFLGKAALGLYQMAQRCVELPFSPVSQSLSQVALTTFARVQSDSARLARGWVSASCLVMSVCAPVSALLAASAPDFLALLVGPSWSEAAPLMSILAVGILFKPLNALSSRAFIALGRTHYVLAVNILLAAFNTAGVLLAAPHGLLWVALVTGLRAWIIGLIVLWMAHRLFRPDWKAYARLTLGPLPPALAMYAGIRLLDDSSLMAGWPLLPRLLAFGLAGLVIYIILLRVGARGAWAEMVRILRRLRPGAPATAGSN